MGYVIWVIAVVGSALLLASIIRWFEHAAIAVDENRWGRLAILIAFPFAVWIYKVRRHRALPNTANDRDV